MRCPFLREAQVKYCQGSAIKKMIARTPSDMAHERCSSSEYVHCSSLKQHHEEHAEHTRCPFLQESLVQYCAASSVTKYVPYSESSIIKCGNDGYRYCDLYLSVAAPGDRSKEDHTPVVEGISLPESLAYSLNHMWLDQTSDSMCYIGVDGFLTKILRNIDAISFAAPQGSSLPTVLLTVHGVDLQLMFPLPVHVTGTNTHLRADLKKLISHPYSSGWLFEGTLKDAGHAVPSEIPSSRFMRGEEATAWMTQEVQHLTEFVHDQIVPSHFGKEPVMMDGGAVHPDILDHLDKRELLNVFNEFFSPYASWRKIS
jgi:glycine cleavage system H lipoate-binding protein